MFKLLDAFISGWLHDLCSTKRFIYAISILLMDSFGMWTKKRDYFTLGICFLLDVYLSV